MKTSMVSRGDAVVLILALLLVASLYLLFWQGGGRSNQAMVLVNGENWARLNLDYNQDLTVPGPLGVSHIQVRDGNVRFVDSPCPTKQCILQGGVNEGGESVVCLPNLVSVHVLADDPRFDSINF